MHVLYIIVSTSTFFKQFNAKDDNARDSTFNLIEKVHLNHCIKTQE
jgi:hypothetical protein